MLTAKRSLVLAAGFVLSSVLGSVPGAEAVGAGICTISGTMNFFASPQGPTQGRWSIEPAVIDCQGLFNGNGRERFVGSASFTGAGSYTTAGDGRAACLQHLGSGTVDYLIRTSEQDIHIVEPQSFVLAGGGSFTTPTLEGAFQVAPIFDRAGQCLTERMTKAFFVAQGVIVRFRRVSGPPEPAGSAERCRSSAGSLPLRGGA